MKKFISILMTATSLCALRADEGDNLLLWMIEEPSIKEINGSSVFVSDLVGRGGAAEGKRVNAVRVKLMNDNFSVYLDLATDEGDWVDHIELPGLMETSSGDYVDYWAAGPTFADISGYTGTANDAGISFMMELGNYTANGDWIVLAVSQTSTLTELRGRNGTIFSDTLNMHTIVPWTPPFSVPEPTSGLLILIGGGLLALRRRRR